ncbi:DnaJ-domain-containing protein [Xylariomycetidae sp. FL0641]|nr:DnaJ-domain-containing protein [Xylariomycetidae sp. FL0641]
MPFRRAVPFLATAAQKRPCLLLPLAFDSASAPTPPSLFPPSSARTTRSPPCSSDRIRYTQQKQQFHTSRPLRDEAIDNATNHYETLKLKPGATPAEVKKNFYALSKKHHPDLHRNDPHASRRFTRLSEAYSVLSVPAKRAQYDRQHLPASSATTSSSSARTSSYASTNPAGGRPASGLSRRRGAFQGPPPSFYRSGGWGAQGGKRRAAHEGSTTHASSSSHHQNQHPQHPSSSSSAGGMGPGQTPYPGARAADAETRHFDRAAHRRTHAAMDSRRDRWAEETASAASYAQGGGLAGLFFIVGGVLLVASFGPAALSGAFWSGGGGSGGGGTKKRETANNNNNNN